jgi:hypothetical protein
VSRLTSCPNSRGPLADLSERFQVPPVAAGSVDINA